MAQKAIPKKETRTVSLDREMVRAEERTVGLAFSSELPVVRPWGIEILDHSKKSVRMERAGKGIALLWMHDHNTHLGRLTDIKVGEDKVARGTARFSKNGAAEEKFSDILDGILTDVSVGYRVHFVEEVKARDLAPDLMKLSAQEKLPVYRITDWEPYEASLVTVAADPTVGIGRSEEPEQEVELEKIEPEKPTFKIEEVREMSEDIKVVGGGKSLEEYDADLKKEREKAGRDAQEKERTRMEGISKIYDKFSKHIPKFIRDKAIKEGMSVEEFQRMALDRLGDGEPIDTPITELGLSNQELKRYSFTRAILSQVKGSGVDCSFEQACSTEIQKRLDIEGRGGIFVPYDTVRKPASPTGTGRRDLSIVGGDAAGAYLVGTDHLGSEFIDVLRNRMVSRTAGARILSGLRGNVAIPKRTAGAATYWPTEGNAPTEGANTFAQLTLSPNTIAANVDYTRNLLLQSNPSVDALVTGDFAIALATGIDLAVFHGGGTEEPQGIVGTSGVGATTATSVDFGKMLDFQTDLAAANALAPGCAYITTPAVAAILAATVKFTYGSMPLWEGGILESSNVCGFRGFSTNQITAGYCIFGDFSQVIIGEWGVLELVVDPYTQSKTGVIQVTAFQSVDVGLRYPAAFSVSTSVTAA